MNAPVQPVASVVSSPKKHNSILNQMWRHKFVYLMLVPTFVMLAIFAYYPAINALYRSLFRWNGVNVNEYVGTQNFNELLSMKIVTIDPDVNEETGEIVRDDEGNFEYASIRRTIRNNDDKYKDYKPFQSKTIGDTQYHLIAKDPVFIQSFINMIILLVADVTKALLIPLLLATMIYHLWSERAKYIFRVLLILPAVVPVVVGALLWKDFYRMPTQGTNFAGLINQVLAQMNPDWQHGWLGDTDTVIPALIFTGFPWVNGASTLIFLAGLIAIPNELYDAANVDGAGAWTIFRKVELPLLRGPMRLVLVFTLIGSVQNYGGILIMTAGGPNKASMVPGLWLYNNAFQFNRYGYSSAIGVILFVILITFTLGTQRLLRSEVDFNP